MNVLSPRLPPGAREMFNALYPTREPRYLTDDLYSVELPGDVFINVGWFPENDPSGAYEVCFYKGQFENQIGPPYETANLGEVIAVIEGVAAALMGASAYTPTISASGSQAVSVPEEWVRATTASNSRRLALVG
jgi:hypothetical protein